MTKQVILISLILLIAQVHPFKPVKNPIISHKRLNVVKMSSGPIGWEELIVQRGLAETIVCPDFGQPGWAPFCFLNGNPVFKAFDFFQAFIQSDIVALHDFLQNTLGISNAYGLSIILFTCIIRLVLSPVTFKQLESTQRTQALQPIVAEIKEKYAGIV